MHSLTFTAQTYLNILKYTNLILKKFMKLCLKWIFTSKKFTREIPCLWKNSPPPEANPRAVYSCLPRGFDTNSYNIHQKPM